MNHAIDVLTHPSSTTVSLRGVRLSVDITGLALFAYLEQTFVNLENRAIEAIYAFPLPPNASVTGFEVRTDDRLFTGVLDEREKAIEKHDNAMRRGDGSYLLESIRPDVFNLSAGNLLPGQAATVKLSYVADLDCIDGEIRLTLPTTLAPRYATLTGETDPARALIDADAINPPTWTSTPYGLELEIRHHSPFGVDVSSPSHDIRTRRQDDTTVITLSAPRTQMDRDVVLILRPLKLAAARPEGAAFAVASRAADGSRYVAVTVVPPPMEEAEGKAGCSRVPAEIAFVLDCSGSMGGQSIAKAKEALSLCLKSCQVGDLVSVLRFGSTFEYLTPEPVRLDGASVQALLDRVESIAADLGGTEMLAPLADLLVRRPLLGSRREVVLLTDGQISNEVAVARLARDQRATNRIFTLAIGSSPSHSLLRDIAHSTGASMEATTGSEQLAPKVLRLFNRIGRPGYTRLALDAGVSTLDTEPGTSGLFPGQTVTHLVRLAQDATANTLLIRLSRDDAPDYIQTVAIRDRDELSAVLPAVFARRRIRALEAAEKTAEATALSLMSRVLCESTAWIAIEHRSEADRNDGKPELRRIPVTLTHEWGEAPAQAAAGGAIVGATCRRIEAPSGADSPTALLDRSVGRMRGISQFFSLRKTAPAGPLSLEDSMGPQDTLLELLGEFEFDGHFKPSRRLRKLLEASGVSKPTWVGHAWFKRKDPKVDLTAWALKVLRVEYADRKQEWAATADKALAWLQSQLDADFDRVESWILGQ